MTFCSGFCKTQEDSRLGGTVFLCCSHAGSFKGMQPQARCREDTFHIFSSATLLSKHQLTVIGYFTVYTIAMTKALFQEEES